MFNAADVPVEFEEFWVSEVQDRCSEEDIDEMVASVGRNKVAIKGRIFCFGVNCLDNLVYSFKVDQKNVGVVHTVLKFVNKFFVALILFGVELLLLQTFVILCT